MGELRIREISATDLRLMQEVGAFRVQVWAARFPEVAARQIWLDEFDAVGRHFGVFAGPKLVAAARVSFHAELADLPDPEEFADMAPVPAPIASLNRLVIAPDYRRQGLRARLVEARLAAAKQAGCRTVVISVWPDEPSVRSMERWGFVCVGLTHVYSTATYGIGAQFMVMALSLRP